MVEITRADREAAWPFRPSQLIRSSYRAAWFSGVYDAQPAIQAFAARRLATIAALEQPTPELVEDTAKGIEGPRCAVPDNSPHTLEELREARWKMLSTQEQATRREEAKAALAAAAKCLKEPTQ